MLTRFFPILAVTLTCLFGERATMSIHARAASDCHVFGRTIDYPHRDVVILQPYGNRESSQCKRCAHRKGRLMQAKRSIVRSPERLALLGALALALSIALLCGCDDPARHDQNAAWKAMTSWIQARTPPGTQMKLTRETSRIVKLGTVEIDFVRAASTGLKNEVSELTATVVKSGREWEVTDLSER